MSERFQTSISKYYLFHFFDSLIFFTPVIVLFWQSKGLSMTQITLLQSIYSIGVILLDVPTGAFADRFGKKKSLMLGSLFWTLGLIWYGLSGSFWQFVIGELIIGTGSAFTSGADRAYIHGLLQTMNKERDFKKVEGSARSVMQVAQAVASVVGGFIGTISLALTLLASAVSVFIGFLTASMLAPVAKDIESHKLTYIQTLRKSFAAIRHNRLVGWYTLFFGFFTGMVFPLFFYTQPLMQVRHIPIEYFGFMYLVMNMLTAIGSMFTHQLEKSLKGWIYVGLSVFTLISIFVVSQTQDILLFVLLWHIPFTALFINQTVISDAVLQLVPQTQAATVLSFQSLLRRIIYVFVGPLLGLAYDTFGMRKALLGYVVILSVVFISLLAMKKTIHPPIRKIP